MTLKRRLFHRTGACVACIAAATILSGTNFSIAATAEESRVEPRLFDSVLTKVVAQLVTTQHYTRRPIDDSFSQELFDEFFDTLDRDRQFFLASDIEEFAGLRNQLDDLVLTGNVAFAFDVYERLLQRVRERVEFARQRLQEPFDLTVEEEVILDRSEEPWSKTVAELDEVWRKRLKNRYLIYFLMDEKRAEEQDAKVENETDEDDPAPNADTEPPAEGNGTQQTTPAVAPKSPEQRVLEFHERYLRFAEENEADDILEIFLSCLTRVYDPHSTYMAPSTEEDFDINMSLSLEGIGAVLSTEDGYVKIVSIIPGGPAESDGQLHEGDRIVAVTQKDAESVDVIDMPLRKVVRLIRGPKGSEVILSVIEAGKSLGSTPTTITIVRDEVKLTEQAAKGEIREVKLPAGDPKDEQITMRVQVITLPSFYSDFDSKREGDNGYASASRDVRRLLTEAREENVDGVVLDLRGNGGGSLEEAIKIAGLFFPEGPVVQVRSVGGKVSVYKDPDKDMVYAGPLAVLVNRFSASASEIVAAALQDHKRAVIIGENSTHGKGTVQTILNLDRFFARHPLFKEEKTGSLKFTIAKFYRVDGGSVQRKGVVPDIVFPSFTDHMKVGEDTLKHALLWDEIEPAKIDPVHNVVPYLPLLLKQSGSRLESNEEFKDMHEAIEHYGEITSRTTMTLNLEQRRQLHKEEEKWTEKARRQISRRGGGETIEGEPAEETADEEEGDTDLVLEEALQIMKDLVWLQSGDILAEHPQLNEKTRQARDKAE